jgi:serine/threonine-protein kinase RIM15
MDLVHRLLNSNPNERLGANGAAEVKAHPFFAGVNWDALMQEPGPMVPKVDDSFSTEYFEGAFDFHLVNLVSAARLTNPHRSA